MKKADILIIGGGPAAYYACSAAVDSSNSHTRRIALVCSEKHLPYFRPKLISSLSADIKAESLYIKPMKWYADNGVEVIYNRAKQIDTSNKEVVFSDESVYTYNRLIIATGAEAYIPEMVGYKKIFKLRTIEDVRIIREEAVKKKNVLIIGGGLLSLETACEFSGIGIQVTVLERSGWLLKKQLESQGGVYLQKLIEAKGVNVLTNAQADDFINDQDNYCVIVQTGVRANMQIAKEAGINTGKGIIVNERMQTSVKDIYACGDAAEYNGNSWGLISVAMRQGTVAGSQATGKNEIYSDVPPSTTLKVKDISFFAIGSTTGDNIIYKKDDNCFGCIVLKDGIIVGASLIGDIRESNILRKAIENKADLSGSQTYNEALNKL